MNTNPTQQQSFGQVKQGSVIKGNNPYQLNRMGVSDSMRKSTAPKGAIGFDAQGNSVVPNGLGNQNMGFETANCWAPYGAGQQQSSHSYLTMTPDNHSVNQMVPSQPQGLQGQQQGVLTPQLLAKLQQSIDKPKQSRKRHRKLNHRIKQGIDTATLETQSFMDTTQQTQQMAMANNQMGAPQVASSNPMLDYRNRQLTNYRNNNTSTSGMPVITEQLATNTSGVPNGNLKSGVFSNPKMDNGLWYGNSAAQSNQLREQQITGEGAQLGSYSECFETGTNLDEAFGEPPARNGWNK